MDPCECTSIASWPPRFSTKKDMLCIAVAQQCIGLQATILATRMPAHQLDEPNAMLRFHFGLRQCYRSAQRRSLLMSFSQIIAPLAAPRQACAARSCRNSSNKTTLHVVETTSEAVLRGLDPRIHLLFEALEHVDARIKSDQVRPKRASGCIAYGYARCCILGRSEPDGRGPSPAKTNGGKRITSVLAHKIFSGLRCPFHVSDGQGFAVF